MCRGTDCWDIKIKIKEISKGFYISFGYFLYTFCTHMADIKVRIDDSLVKKIRTFRKKKKENLIRYSSDKHFVQIAILELLEKEGKKNERKRF